MRAGDTLNGHADDAEQDLAQPLVSLSLGCDAVFLMGGETKAVPPTPLLLRSGDAVVLSGHARRCVHGLPRVLTDHPPAAAMQCGGGGSGSGADGGGSSEAHNGSSSDGSGGGLSGAEFVPFARHMRGCRINVSIRDTR